MQHGTSQSCWLAEGCKIILLLHQQTCEQWQCVKKANTEPKTVLNPKKPNCSCDGSAGNGLAGSLAQHMACAGGAKEGGEGFLGVATPTRTEIPSFVSRGMSSTPDVDGSSSYTCLQAIAAASDLLTAA